jgi:hypothetical protein
MLLRNCPSWTLAELTAALEIASVAGIFRCYFGGALDPVMPILLCYLPFTVFYGACDLLFVGLEMEVNEGPADLDQVWPEEEATQH